MTTVTSFAYPFFLAFEHVICPESKKYVAVQQTSVSEGLAFDSNFAADSLTPKGLCLSLMPGLRIRLAKNLSK